MKLSVIIPAYNEEKSIISTLEKIISYLKNQDYDYEVIVINDGSNDKTGELVEGKQHPNLKLLHHLKNLGKGAAIKTGVKEASGDLILFMDADYSTSIEEVEKFLPKAGEYDVIIGSRALKNSKITVKQPFIKELLGKIGNKLIQIAAVPGVKDTQCGFKLFSQRALAIFDKQTINGWGFDIELLFLARKYNLKILELPVTWENSQSSKVEFFDYFKTLMELFKIKLNNLRNLYEKN